MLTRSEIFKESSNRQPLLISEPPPPYSRENKRKSHNIANFEFLNYSIFRSSKTSFNWCSCLKLSRRRAKLPKIPQFTIFRHFFTTVCLFEATKAKRDKSPIKPKKIDYQAENRDYYTTELDKLADVKLKELKAQKRKRKQIEREEELGIRKYNNEFVQSLKHEIKKKSEDQQKKNKSLKPVGKLKSEKKEGLKNKTVSKDEKSKKAPKDEKVLKNQKNKNSQKSQKESEKKSKVQKDLKVQKEQKKADTRKNKPKVKPEKKEQPKPEKSTKNPKQQQKKQQKEQQKPVETPQKPTKNSKQPKLEPETKKQQQKSGKKSKSQDASDIEYGK